jgi:hypothetical protein
MKKLMIISTLLLVLTGCGQKDIEAYYKAFNKSVSFETGVMTVDVKVNSTFDLSDLSDEEAKEMALLDEMQFIYTMEYNEKTNLNKSTTYTQIMGTGNDTLVYVSEDEVILELPNIGKYAEIEVEEDDFAEDFDDVFNDLFAKWQEILEEEDVVVGKNRYIETDQGQIKATTYHLYLNDEQINELSTYLIELTEDERFIEMMQEINPDATVNSNTLKDFLDKLDFIAIDGEAFVDFDGILVRQTARFTVVSDELDYLNEAVIELNMNWEQLGEDIEILMPKLTDENTIDLDEVGGNE